VKSIYNFLVNNDLSALWLSSEQNQSTRIATLKKLKMNECKILVTTDLAARGIDVHNVNLVVNLGLPMPPDVYVHRMGRAGRYGSEGEIFDH
jgi:ATP-dependent RNA helicase DDX20